MHCALAVIIGSSQLFFVFFIQFPSVESLMPRLFAAAAKGWSDSSTNCTASSLYSWVYFRGVAPHDAPSSWTVDFRSLV